MNVFLPHFLTFVSCLRLYRVFFLWDRQLSCLSYLLMVTPLIYFDHFLLDDVLHCTCFIVRKCVVNTSLLPLLHGFTQYLHGRKLIFCSFVGGWPHDLTWLDWRFSKKLTLANVKATRLFCKSFITKSEL